MAATLPTRQHPIQIAGRIIGLVMFLAMAFAGGRNLLLEPRTSPLDVVLWTGVLLLGSYLSVLALASLTHRLPASPDGMLAPRVALPVHLLMVGIALWALIVTVSSERWLAAGVSALFGAAQAYIAVTSNRRSA